MLLSFVAVLTLLGCGENKPAAPEPSGAVKVNDYRISGPYTHENLSVYLVHATDKIKGDKFLTLKEGLEQKLVVIHETSNVQELSIENKSDMPLFIQSGEIIRGGKQDRICPYDVVISPKSGRKPLKSFCVESGRWSGRGGEDSGFFGSSDNLAPTVDLKIAALEKSDQGAVWGEVKKSQDKLSSNLGGSVRSSESETSMELTLSSEEVQKAIEGRLEALGKLPQGKDDIIGYAYAINGEVQGVDIYGNKHLFRKLWPKLIKASATESVAELQKGKDFKAPQSDAVAAFMKDARKNQTRIQKQSEGVLMRMRTGSNYLYTETVDEKDSDGNKPVHETYIKKKSK